MSSTSRLLSICPDCTCSMHTQVPYRLVPFHMHFLLYLLFNLLSIAISLAGTAYTDCLWFSQQGLHVNSSLGPLPVPAFTKIETTAIWRFHIPFQLRGLWGASKTLVHCVSLLPQKKRPWVFCRAPRPHAFEANSHGAVAFMLRTWLVFNHAIFNHYDHHHLRDLFFAAKNATFSHSTLPQNGGRVKCETIGVGSNARRVPIWATNILFQNWFIKLEGPGWLKIHWGRPRQPVNCHCYLAKLTISNSHDSMGYALAGCVAVRQGWTWAIV